MLIAMLVVDILALIILFFIKQKISEKKFNNIMQRIFTWFIIIILFLIVSYKINPILAPIGVAAATIFQYIPYIPAIRNTGYKHRFIVNFKDENIKRMLILALPIIFGVAVNQINILIDQNLASFISVKGISVLTYSLRLYEFVWGIMIVSITTAIYPTLSRLAIESTIKFKVQITKTISTILYLVIPSTIGIMLFSKEIVTLIYKRGKFDESDVILVSGALFYYASGLIGLGIRDVLSSSFYALKLTKIPLINSIQMVVLNVVASIILSKSFCSLSSTYSQFLAKNVAKSSFSVSAI